MRVTDIQRFCMHDGPGIRTVVFLKGCPLRCAWCHNPETQSSYQEILFYPEKCIGCGACEAVCPVGAHQLQDGGHRYDRARCMVCTRCAEICCSKALEPAMKQMTANEIFEEVEKDRAFYGGQGGLTISGGEPMIQASEVMELLRICKNHGISTAIETCGYFDPAILPQMISLTDSFLWDFKDGNEERHKKYTGVSNAKIKSNLLLADSLGAATILRCIMVQKVNMQEDHYDAIAELWHQLKHCRYVELIPYHAYGGSKMIPLGKEGNGHPEWIPTGQMMQEAGTFLLSRGVRLK